MKLFSVALINTLLESANQQETQKTAFIDLTLL